MSAPGRRTDSPKGVGKDAWAALYVPSGFVRSAVFRDAHIRRHPFVPAGLLPNPSLNTFGARRFLWGLSSFTSKWLSGQKFLLKSHPLPTMLIASNTPPKKKSAGVHPTRRKAETLCCLKT
jgi:hypothetical protein